MIIDYDRNKTLTLLVTYYLVSVLISGIKIFRLLTSRSLSTNNKLKFFAKLFNMPSPDEFIKISPTSVDLSWNLQITIYYKVWKGIISQNSCHSIPAIRYKIYSPI